MFGMGVLNLTVAMKLFFGVMLLVFGLVLPAGLTQQVDVPARLLSPLPGEALQGVVMIQVELDPTQVSGFELDYAYQDGASPTWFLISESQAIDSAQILAAWDTTTISDGDYQLRIRVILKNGLFHETSVPGLRIRNYSTIETSTPSPTPVVTGTPILPTATMQNTPTMGFPTALPENPVRFDQSRMIEGILDGLLVVVGIFAFLGIYSGIRHIQRKRE